MSYAGAHPTFKSCGSFQFAGKGKKAQCTELATLLNRTATRNCKQEIGYQFYSVNAEWDYTCSKEKDVKNSITVQMIGVMIGALAFGQVSDTFGRRKALSIALTGAIIMGYLSSFTWNLVFFTIARFLIGVFNGGVISVTQVFFIENLPKQHRMWINMVITWSPNMIIFAIIAWLSGDWRTLARVTATLTIPALILLFFASESPKWLAGKGRFEEAKAVVKRIAKFDGKSEELKEDELDAVLAKERAKQEEAAAASSKKRYSYYHLFYTWTLMEYSLVLAFSLFTASVTMYGLLFNM